MTTSQTPAGQPRHAEQREESLSARPGSARGRSVGPEPADVETSSAPNSGGRRPVATKGQVRPVTVSGDAAGRVPSTPPSATSATPAPVDPPARLLCRPLAMAGAACLVATIVLGALLGAGDGPTGVDAWAWEVADWPPLWRALNLLLFDRAWVVFGSLFSIGTPGVTVALGVGLAVAHWWRGEARVAATCLLAPIAAISLAGLVFKPLFDRTYKGGLVYPSTHATAALAAGTLLVVLAYRSGGIRRAVAAAGLWAIVVFVVVLYLLEGELHYLTDVIGGVGLGVGTTLLVVAAILGRRSSASR